MANTKKQDKPSAVPEQAVPEHADPASNPPPGGSDINIADAAKGGLITDVPGAALGADAAREPGSSTAELPVGPVPVVTLAEDAAGVGALLSQPGRADDALHDAADAAGLDNSTSSASVELNPARVKVYPLRSFMDEGELRRRGGPSYLVPRLHAEDLEQRNLVSRAPLEE